MNEQLAVILNGYRCRLVTELFYLTKKMEVAEEELPADCILELFNRNESDEPTGLPHYQVLNRLINIVEELDDSIALLLRPDSERSGD